MGENLGNGWIIDLSDEVGRGGFGRVVAALHADGTRAVAKLIPKEPGADRELLAAQLPTSAHIVPVFQVAETEREWVVLMPRAAKSLRDRLIDGQALGLAEGVEILTAIAQGLTALAEADPAVVHRDLKPENVLMLDGNWAICDFGISRYAEAATATDTHKHRMTAAYAAPEQWRQERASSATDVYAFGILAYEVCTGSRPFPGPTATDFREQHLHGAPPAVQALPNRLQSILWECLQKPAGARPRAQNLVARLSSALTGLQRPGASALADAQRATVRQQAEQARIAEEARTESERRDALGQSAVASLQLIGSELGEVITDNAPAARLNRSGGRFALTLGEGSLEIDAPIPATGAALAHYSVDLDVVQVAHMQVNQASTSYTRSHSLWFCNWDDPEVYAWYELSFMTLGFGAMDRNSEPFHLPPNRDAAVALSNVVGNVQAARAAQSLRPAEIDEFIDRWSLYLAQASRGALRRPQSLPEGALNYPRRGRR